MKCIWSIINSLCISGYATDVLYDIVVWANGGAPGGGGAGLPGEHGQGDDLDGAPLQLLLPAQPQSKPSSSPAHPGAEGLAGLVSCICHY